MPAKNSNSLIGSINAFRLKRGFKKLEKNIAQLKDGLTANEVIDFLFSTKGALVAPWQFKEEMLNLAKVYEKHKPVTIMEIGTANGGTLFMHSKLAANNAFIVSVDLPGGKFGGGYPESKVPLYKSFARPGSTIELVRADSHQQSTMDMVKKLLGDRMLDYLFIDGDHTYEGVKKDFYLYKPLVKEHGIIVFHDVAHHKNSSCEVDKFWREIKTQYKSEEFIKDANQNCFGIGVIYL